MELARIIDEIQLIPKERLGELYDFIHFFRLGLETASKNTTDIMDFAGCWQDMPDDEFQNFLQDITERRQQAFSERISRESIAD